MKFSFISVLHTITQRNLSSVEALPWVLQWRNYRNTSLVQKIPLPPNCKYQDTQCPESFIPLCITLNFLTILLGFSNVLLVDLQRVTLEIPEIFLNKKKHLKIRWKCQDHRKHVANLAKKERLNATQVSDTR